VRIIFPVEKGFRTPKPQIKEFDDLVARIPPQLRTEQFDAVGIPGVARIDCRGHLGLFPSGMNFAIDLLDSRKSNSMNFLPYKLRKGEKIIVQQGRESTLTDEQVETARRELSRIYIECHKKMLEQIKKDNRLRQIILEPIR
jgi:hypothetical protein